MVVTSAPVTSTPVTLAPGQRVGPFVLLAPLGSGGSGRVWAAAQLGRLGFTKRVALKMLRVDKLASARARRRFEAEARLGAQLSHRNLRAVHDLGSHEGHPYMALRWVETSLEELLLHSPGRRLPAEVVCWFGIQCCEALAAAHGFVDRSGRASAIVHRDVSPSNLLITARGDVLLSDLAGPSEQPDASAHAETPDARFFGNLGYASPEALKQQPLDGRADLFSLGCVLYEALSGAPPFDAEYEHSLVFQVLEQDAPKLRERAPALPEGVVAVVNRAMARCADARFENAPAMGRALSACVAELSAFALEELAAATIQQALGAKIRAREEAVYAAFQRFSWERSGQTDTLPLLDPATAPSLPNSRGSEPGAITRTASDPATSPGLGAGLRRVLGPGLAAVALAVLLYLVIRPVPRVVPTRPAAVPSSAAAGPGERSLSEVTQQQLPVVPAPPTPAPQHAAAPPAAPAPTPKPSRPTATQPKRAASESPAETPRHSQVEPSTSGTLQPEPEPSRVDRTSPEILPDSENPYDALVQPARSKLPDGADAPGGGQRAP